jgi:hypothetical protein
VAKCTPEQLKRLHSRAKWTTVNVGCFSFLE